MVQGGLATSIVSLLKREDPKEKNGALAALRNLSLASQFFFLLQSRKAFMTFFFFHRGKQDSHGPVWLD